MDYQSKLIELGLIDNSPIILNIRLPLAPSTNHLNTQAGKHKGRVKLASVTRWDNIAVAKIRMRLGREYTPPADRFYSVLMLHTFKDRATLMKSDADNRLKQALDSLARAMKIDDRLFFRVQTIKAGIASWKSSSTVIIVQSYPIADVVAGFRFLTEFVESVDE